MKEEMKAKINVLNYNLNRYGLVDEYQSFSFIRHYNDVGEFTITINSASQQAHLLTKGAFIMVENDARKFGLIGHKTSKQEEDGTSTFTFKGKTLGVILNWREIVMSENEVNDWVQGNIETVLYHYVNNHCVNPFDSDRRIPLLRAANDQKRGQNVKWSSSKGKVLDTVKTISNIYDIGWRFNADTENKTWVYEVYEGRDLSVGNKEGNAPVIFSDLYENIDEMIYIEDDWDERNFAYVLSDKEGNHQKLYESGRITGFERREVTFEISGRDDKDNYVDVPDLASKQLEEYFTVKNLEANIKNCEMYRFERDFDLGDIVTIQRPEWNVSENLRMVTIEETYSEEGLELYATFGKRIPSVIDKMKRESKVYEINK